MKASRMKTLLFVGAGILMLWAATANGQSKEGATAGSAAMPDVVGIRPGMPAQEAYNLLKARNPNEDWYWPTQDAWAG